MPRHRILYRILASNFKEKGTAILEDALAGNATKGLHKPQKEPIPRDKAKTKMKDPRPEQCSTRSLMLIYRCHRRKTQEKNRVVS
jgi:hypothetical protein